MRGRAGRRASRPFPRWLRQVFTDYDQFRYRNERHLPACIEALDVRTRLTLRELPYKELRQGSVLDLPFADDSFDMMFSHGVLHHVPEIKQAQREIHRVLRPGGELVIMMYARWSLN